VVVLGAFLGGYATLVESSALAALYAFFTQTVVHRDISVRRDLRGSWPSARSRSAACW